jgi:hypothetical protein
MPIMDYEEQKKLSLARRMTVNYSCYLYISGRSKRLPDTMHNTALIEGFAQVMTLEKDLHGSCKCAYTKGQGKRKKLTGFKSYDKPNIIQNRAQRSFLGVHKFSNIVVVNGDMGWTAPIVRRKLNILRL